MNSREKYNTQNIWDGVRMYLNLQKYYSKLHIIITAILLQNTVSACLIK